MESDFGNLRFSDFVRKQLKEGFLKHKGGSQIVWAREAELFIVRLEGLSDSIPQFQRAMPKDIRYKEELRSIAGHLKQLKTRLSLLDTAVLGHFLECGAAQQEKRTGVPTEELGQHRMMFKAVEMRAAVTPALEDLAKGAMVAADTLPPYDFDIKLKIALGVERLFWESQIKFSITDTGFAAECLRSIFDAGGLSTKSIKYELKKARDNEQSMKSLMTRLRAR